MRDGVPRQANQNSQQEQSLVRLSSRLRQGERHATGSITPSYDINLCLVCCQTSKAVHKQNLSEKITKEYQGPITLQVSGSNMTTLPHPPSELGLPLSRGAVRDETLSEITPPMRLQRADHRACTRSWSSPASSCLSDRETKDVSR